MYKREIKFDRESRDFAMYLEGEFVGYAANYHEAEIELDRLAYALADSGVAFPKAGETTLVYRLGATHAAI